MWHFGCFSIRIPEVSPFVTAQDLTIFDYETNSGVQQDNIDRELSEVQDDNFIE